MNYLFLSALLLSSVLGRAQTKDSTISWYHVGRNKSAVVIHTSPLTLRQRIEILELSNAAITRLLTETRAKLDSLANSLTFKQVDGGWYGRNKSFVFPDGDLHEHNTRTSTGTDGATFIEAPSEWSCEDTLPSDNYQIFMQGGKYGVNWLDHQFGTFAIQLGYNPEFWEDSSVHFSDTWFDDSCSAKKMIARHWQQVLDYKAKHSQMPELVPGNYIEISDPKKPDSLVGEMKAEKIRLTNK